MHLHVLPDRSAGAAENMAVDFLLLQRYPHATEVRFRHYDWRSPAVTFGYSQKVAWVREEIGMLEGVELCRRVTGGGIVDHRNDWTYALVLPRGHAAEEMRAAHSYRLVHEALAAALVEQGVPAVLKPCGEEQAACGPKAGLGRRAGGQGAAELVGGVCFQRAEVFDVVHAQTGGKIAGAAQKRNKHGLLLQGSVARAAVESASVDWDVFRDRFVAALGTALEVAVEVTSWPEFQDDEVDALTEQYSSPEWIEYR